MSWRWTRPRWDRSREESHRTGADGTLKDAAEMFARYGFRALPVSDEHDKFLGIIPYRDVMNLEHRYLE